MTEAKIIAFPMPAAGHMNPFLAAVKEIAQKTSAKIIIYSTENFKKRIEEYGCEYRYLGELLTDKLQDELGEKVTIVDVIPKIIETIFKVIDENIIRIVNDIEAEKPTIIMYDNISAFAKWFIRLLKMRFENKSTFPSSLERMPKLISYHTSFVHQNGIYPNANEHKLMMSATVHEKIQMLFILMKLSNQGKRLGRKYNIEYKNIMEDLMVSDTNILNIAFILPQLQPREHLFHKNIIFVGASIVDDENLVNLNKVTDESMKKFLQKFHPKNPNPHIPKEDEKLLIYVSLGSVYQANYFFYLKIINFFKTINQDVAKNRDARIKGENVYGIITVGKKLYERFTQEKFEIPANVKLVPFAPQLEILKRASLFLTHCGMNSTSESIHFSVPMICLPATADQPLVAYRVTKELGLGIQLNLESFQESELQNTVYEIISDKKLKQRIYDYSLLSKEHDGTKSTLEVIKTFI